MAADTPLRKSAIRTAFHDLPANERVAKRGHRRYVGGPDPERWYGIGRRQYHFLVSQGLASHHRLLDVACGALRLGQYAIPMLDKGHYYGLEGEPSLVEAGLTEEMLFDVAALKTPQFSHNYDFDLSFCPGYDFAMAQSLFTHLTLDDIALCFENMISVARPGSKFFWTFFDDDGLANPEGQSHPNLSWRYAFEDIEERAAQAGFRTTYIGDWGHPVDQLMAVSEPSS